MSKINISTRTRILAHALTRFNQDGIEYVGLRELAAELDMRVSNITYYFPTKDDLVYALGDELRALNTGIMQVETDLSLSRFFDLIRQTFYNHYAYRSLFVSFVHIMKQNRTLAASYKKTEGKRFEVLRNMVQRLGNNGELNIQTDDTLEFLVSTIAFLSRFWLSEAAITYAHLTPDEVIRHYMHMLTGILRPHATAKGKKAILEWVRTS